MTACTLLGNFEDNEWTDMAAPVKNVNLNNPHFHTGRPWLLTTVSRRCVMRLQNLKLCDQLSE